MMRLMLKLFDNGQCLPEVSNEVKLSMGFLIKHANLVIWMPCFLSSLKYMLLFQRSVSDVIFCKVSSMLFRRPPAFICTVGGCSLGHGIGSLTFYALATR